MNSGGKADGPEQENDWGETLVRLAGALGFNKVRVRWQLQIQRRKWSRLLRRSEQKKQHITYEHKVCPRCGQLNDQGEKHCTACELDLAGRRLEVLHRIGLSLPIALSVSSLLGVAITLVYVRCIAAEWPDAGLLSLKIETLFRHGGHWTPSVLAGQYWRWITCIFLHAGLWHIGFNLFALSQIGPMVEELFGRGRMLLLFMVTGLAGSVVSHLWGLYGVGIGASGAIMGLCGVAAGWGQREGTTVGLGARNMMIKWAAYTMLFGYFIGADNAAHAGGFLSGGLIGFVLQPAQLRRSASMKVEVLQATLGGAAALAATLLCFFPPAPVEGLQSSFALPNNPYTRLAAVCRQLNEGKMDEALEKYLEIDPGDAPNAEANAAMLEQYCTRLKQMVAQCRQAPEQKDGPSTAGEASARLQACALLLEAFDN